MLLLGLESLKYVHVARCCLLFCVLLCTQSYGAASGLTWLEKHKTIVVNHRDDVFCVLFNLINAGETNVSNILIQPSCSCVTAKLDKEIYRPKEEGVLTVSFQTTQQSLHYKILIAIDDRLTRPVQLSVDVNVRQIADINPIGISWGMGELPITKHITVSIADGSLYHLSKVESSDPHFKIDMTNTGSDRKYIVSVTPTDTSCGHLSTLHFIADAIGEKSTDAYGFARVRPKELNLLGQN